MESAGYRLVFDLSEVGYRYWKFPVIILCFLAVLVGVFLIRNSFKKDITRIEHLFFFAIILISGMAGGIFFTSTFFSYLNAAKTLASGKASYVDGKVQDFSPMPFEGHAKESFRVDGIRFEYSDYVLSSGYNKTLAHGGAIREGALVKIWYLDGQILRLEVK